jgi:transcriptional regulator with XRE-family HTH domain
MSTFVLYVLEFRYFIIGGTYLRRRELMTTRLRVKDVLKEKGISIGKLSRGADVPITLARRMVNDPNYMPSSATLLKVARYLNVPMESLLYDDEEGEPDGQ